MHAASKVTPHAPLTRRPWRPLANTHWTLTLATIALIVGACDSSGLRPSASSAASAPPMLTPATLTPTSTPAVTRQPPETCPPDPGTIQASLEIQTPTGFETVDIQADPLPSPASVDPLEIPIVATLLGGVDVTVVIRMSGGPDDTAEIPALTADFLPFGTATTLPVSVEVDGTTASLRLPDRDLKGQLRVSVSWSTSCTSGDGTGAVGMSVVDSSVAAGCPSTATGLEANLAGFASMHATVGTVDVPLIITGWTGRWIADAGASDIPEFAGWDRDSAATAAPGASVVLSEAIADLALVSIRASTYLRADVVAYLEPDSTDDLGTLAVVRRPANAKGRAGIPVPLEPGSYVIEIEGVWLTPCLSLETYTAVSVDVR